MTQDGEQKELHHHRNTVLVSKSVIESLVAGSLSSAFTTIVYQPLELLKTQIQLRATITPESNSRLNHNVIGRATKSATKLVREHSLSYLWRGMGASLVRSVPGVGIYYASLNLLQSNISDEKHKPNTSLQAFYFGLIARSFVSFLFLPVTSVKVRYESGRIQYSSLSSALREAYLRNGWVGISPTILRDSLFSGTYYMCYTELKCRGKRDDEIMNKDQTPSKTKHFDNFKYGLISGFIASLLTNPLDVLKTNIQIETQQRLTMSETARRLLKQERGILRFFDGLAPRSLRRTLIAATTWTFYEMMTEVLRLH